MGEYGSLLGSDFSSANPPLSPGASSKKPPGLSVDRETLLDVLKRRKDRATACRSLPVAMVMYALAMYTVVEHGRIGDSFNVETSLVDNVVYAGENGFPDSIFLFSDWFHYVNDEWIPAVLNTYDELGNVIEDLDKRGRVSQYNLIVGGVRLTQRRGINGQCKLASVRALYGSCHNPASTDTAEFGNVTVAQQFGVESAFVPSTLDNDVSYEFFLSAIDDVETNIAFGKGLEAAQWIDAATETVSIQLAIVNGEVGFFGRVEMTAEFGRGGRLNPSFRVTSLHIDPYLQYPYLEMLDVLFILYLLYLIAGTLRRILKAVRTSSSVGQAIKQLTTWWRMLDYAVVCTLISCMALFGGVLSQLSEIRNLVSPDSTPADYAQASDLQLKILKCADDFRDFKEAMVWLVIFMSFRLMKYFLFQPRLAVMGESFARAFDDMVHYGIVFGVILCMFGVWGHFMFGTQAYDWRDVPTSITTVMRFIQYDYDLGAMQQTYSAYADFYFSALLLGVTNLTIWMFFGVILASYDEVRLERLKGPTIWQEAGAYLATLPSATSNWTVIRWCKGQSSMYSPFGSSSSSGSDGASAADVGSPLTGKKSRRSRIRTGAIGSSSSSGGGGKGEATWGEVIAALTTGSLRDAKWITPEQLRSHLGLSEATASLLLADVIASAIASSNGEGESSAVLYGSDWSDSNALTPEVKAQLMRLERSKSFAGPPAPPVVPLQGQHAATDGTAAAAAPAAAIHSHSGPDNTAVLLSLQQSMAAIQQQIQVLQATVDSKTV